MTAGRFLQRMVDQGSMPLAKAVRPAWPAHAPAGHEAAEVTETARPDPASSAWTGPPPERAVGATARAPHAPPGPSVSTESARPEPSGPRGVSPQPPAPAPPLPQLPGSRPREPQPREQEPREREPEPGDPPGTEPREGSRPPDGAGARPAAPLRDAGIRSVTRPSGEASLTRSSPPDAPGAAAVPGSGRPAAQWPGGQDEQPPEQWRDRWRDLGQRLLAEHPPAVPAGPAPPPAREAARAAPPLAREAARLSPPQPAAAAPQDAESDLPQVFPPGATAGAGPADRPPELIIEHLEVRLTPPAPGAMSAPAPPPVSRRVWDTAARHYLGRL